MFFTLLIVSFLVSVAVCFLVTKVFQKPIGGILQRLIKEEIFVSWSKYLTFAIYVVGISGGVRIWELQRYITPERADEKILELTNERWVLEMYSTIIGTMQSIAWILLLFFIFALIAYVIVRGQEVKQQTHS
ncbi:MAG: hypothetical protein PHP42_08280 [Bacteroidota bacterium]|nr:hypothetical protein [Bacteroidota bacterium]